MQNMYFISITSLVFCFIFKANAIGEVKGGLKPIEQTNVEPVLESFGEDVVTQSAIDISSTSIGVKGYPSTPTLSFSTKGGKGWSPVTPVLKEITSAVKGWSSPHPISAPVKGNFVAPVAGPQAIPWTPVLSPQPTPIIRGPITHHGGFQHFAPPPNIQNVPAIQTNWPSAPVAPIAWSQPSHNQDFTKSSNNGWNSNVSHRLPTSFEHHIEHGPVRRPSVAHTSFMQERSYPSIDQGWQPSNKPQGMVPTIPQTSFNCEGKPFVPGMYADEETGCRVYHYCIDDRQESFFCGEGTLFNQEILTCDHPQNVACQASQKFWSANQELGKSSGNSQWQGQPVQDNWNSYHNQVPASRSAQTGWKPSSSPIQKPINQNYNSRPNWTVSPKGNAKTTTFFSTTINHKAPSHSFGWSSPGEQWSASSPKAIYVSPSNSLPLKSSSNFKHDNFEKTIRNSRGQISELKATSPVPNWTLYQNNSNKSHLMSNWKTKAANLGKGTPLTIKMKFDLNSISFDCDRVPYQPGLYGDTSTNCQVYHVCFEGRRESFICGEGTIFNQEHLVCDHKDSTKCENTEKFYSSNQRFLQYFKSNEQITPFIQSNAQISI